MLLMPAAPERRPVCRMHRFGGQAPQVIVGVRTCAQGHAHETDLKLYHCTGCGFPLTMPLED